MQLKLKSAEEILARFVELVRRYRRRYIRRNLRPCPINCLGRNTNIFIKGRGAVPIGENLGQQMVLNSTGLWINAEVKSFGIQPLQRVRITYTGNSKKLTIFATPGHRWKLTDGTEKSTSDLKRGDHIPFIQFKRKHLYDSVDYYLGIKHGLIYGDGNAHWIPSRKGSSVRACKRVEGYNIRICSDVEDILPHFGGYPISYPPSAGGDPIVRMYDSFAATHDLKSLPPDNETEDYIVGFFRGWLAADGNVGRNGNPSLCCGPDEESWIRSRLPNFGYYFMGSTPFPSETNFGKRKKAVRVVSLFRPSVSEDEFIIERKRKRFRVPKDFQFVVSDVSLDTFEDEVFCAIVPGTEDFALEMGLLTGNCKMAELLGREVVGCPACHSRNPEFCKDEARFIPFFSKQELVDQFNRMLRDPQVLLHDYRDIVAFLFVLGAFDEPRSVPENIIQGKEGR